MIKTKLFYVNSSGDSYELEQFQKQNPKLKIIDTKIITETYYQNKLMITYEELDSNKS